MPFPVNCSTPSSAALSAYLPTVYDIGDRRDGNSGMECFFVHQGWCDVYLVRTPGVDLTALYFLKVYAPAWRTESDIHFELDFIAHVVRKGVSAALPVPCRDGSLIHPLDLPEGRRYIVLFHAAPGRPLAEQSIDVQCRTLGAVAAQLHDAAEGFASPHGRAQLVDRDRFLDLSPLESFAAGRECEILHLRRVADRVRDLLDSLPLSALREGVCHGDLGGANVFLNGEPGGPLCVIDFDDCGPSWYAYDLGNVALYLHWFHADAADRHWQTFLEGYRSRRSVEEAELAAAPVLAMARFLQIHANHNPIGAARDRWPSVGWADGSQWDWLIKLTGTLENRLL